MPSNKEIVLSGPGKDPEYIPVDKNPFRIGKSPVNERPVADILDNVALMTRDRLDGKLKLMDRRFPDKLY